MPDVNALQPDLADAFLFVDLIRGEDQPATFQWYDDGKKSRVVPGFIHGTLSEHCDRLADLNKEGAGIFLMANPGDLKGRSESNVIGVEWVFADLDGAPLEPARNWKFSPHIITQTSPGPDGKPRYQVFWRVRNFPWTNDLKLNKARFSSIQKAICDRFSGDPKITKDLCRVMRVPGYYHMKREPFLCRLEDIKSRMAVYDAQDFIHDLGLDKRDEKPSVQPGVAEKQVPDKIPESSRNCTLTEHGGRLRSIGYEFDEIRAMLLSINDRRCDPPLRETEVTSIARSVSKYPVGKSTKSQQQAVIPIGISFAELATKDLPAPRHIIEGILPEGLCLLAGAPKARKSWMALNSAVAVALGQQALGHYRVEQGTVLHLSLEDNPRRFQERLRIVLNGRPAPGNAHFFDRWPRLNEGGVDCIHKYLLADPDTRLVIIDTLAVVKPVHSKTSQAYHADYNDLAQLQQLAGQHGVAILLIHHTRKAESPNDVMDEISGTRGLTGCADTLMVLKPEHRENCDATLHVSGRDVESASIALSFDPETGSWRYVGTAAEVKLSQERRDVLNALAEQKKGLSITEVSQKLGRPYKNVQRLLGKLVDEGMVQKAAMRGLYQVVNEDHLYGASAHPNGRSSHV